MEKISYPKEVQSFFNEIILKIRDSLDPDFILIAGSFGKESWLYSGQELISDFELVFVCKKRWSLNKKKLLLKELNKEYPYEISLKGYLIDNIENKIISNYAVKNPGYISLDFFDTFYDTKYIYARNNKTLDIDCSGDEIPVWEAWRLYVNRMGDLLEMDYNEKNNIQKFEYYWLKIFESTADSYLIINKRYYKNILNRYKIFNKELIENDVILDDKCKSSINYIKMALFARYKHDLGYFRCELSIIERKEIINSWMNYFEKKLSEKEQIPVKNDKSFYINYLNNNRLQKKYLGFKYIYNITLSNGIRLLHNPNLLNYPFKFYNNSNSWRHIILLSISSAFSEKSLSNSNFPQAKYILSKIISEKEIITLTEKKFINTILNYWKILR